MLMSLRRLFPVLVRVLMDSRPRSPEPREAREEGRPCETDSTSSSRSGTRAFSGSKSASASRTWDLRVGSLSPPGPGSVVVG